VQFELSDWDFLLSQMDRIGKICLVNDGEVAFKKPDLAASPVLDVLFGATILEYQADIDSRHQLKSVKAKSWDFSQQAITEVSAEEPAVAEEPGNITATNLADVLGIDDYKLVHSGKLAQEELQAWADAKLMKQRLAKITGSVKFQGYPQLLPGAFIKLNGVGDRFNGPVFVNSVKHEYAKGDWSTEVTYGMRPEWYSQAQFPLLAEAEYGRIPSHINGLIIGIATDLVDPDGENRVKIKIPAISDSEEGVWARVATLDAGKERGTFFMPEIDDEVIVGFLQNDVSHPVILGMVNSSSLPAPLTASNDNPEKGYVSREKIKMIFNDAEKSFKIETPAGKKVTISEQDALIKIEDENGNKITMDSAGITIEAAATLTLKGGAEVKIEAPSVSVNGSGTTTIKGGMVQIN
jgi:Rhs element Vgr protein